MSLLKYLSTRSRLWWVGFGVMCAASYVIGLLLGAYYLVVAKHQDELANTIAAMPDTMRFLWLMIAPCLP